MGYFRNPPVHDAGYPLSAMLDFHGVVEKKFVIFFTIQLGLLN